jgi:signal transduction histidine kinase
MVPLFSILDKLVVEEFFTGLLAIRWSIVAACAAIAWMSYQKAYENRGAPLSALAVVLIALAIAIMVHLHDLAEGAAPPSNYYAGIMLVVTAATLLVIWTIRESIFVVLIIYVFYILPTLLIQLSTPSSRFDWKTFVANNFFLVATLLVSLVAHRFQWAAKWREYLANEQVEKSNADLERANSRLKDLDRYKTQFFANITHELKTPLTLILAPTEAILRNELGRFDEGQQEYFRRIYQNGLRLMRLISDLLDLAKLEDSKLRLKLDDVDLVEYLNGLLAGIRPLAERKSIHLEMSVTGTDSTISADRHRLEQIFVNFLSNAVKFTGEGGHIRILVEATHDDVHVCVQDSGVGIPADKVASIFERFSQVDGSSTRKYGGTGIGLALARELTQLHGGSIWAESELGVGTKVHTRFKKGRSHFRDEVVERRSEERTVADNRRNEGAMPEWWEQLSSGNNFRFIAVDDASERRLAPRERIKPKEGEVVSRVLVVEDTREMLQFIQLQLREHFDVYLAENGVKGLEMCQKIKPDLVVTDYMMPEMDGKEMTSLIKSNPETTHIPVVMLTAKADEAARVEGREAGADEYLAKPFSTTELIAVIRNLLKTQAKQADRLMTQKMDSLQIVAGRMAHEIHNPLNYIRNGALLAQRSIEKLVGLMPQPEVEGDDEAAKRKKLIDKVHTMVDQITLGADRISKSVDLLKEYAREGYKAVDVDYDVDSGIEKIIQVVAPKDSSKRHVHFQRQNAGMVRCVPQEFHEVISNLIQNAMDATKDDQSIWVSAERQDDNKVVRILVRDEGEGISEENIDRIFNPMFTTKAPGQGMGMGLSITHRLIHRVGGKIKVMSTLGEGTTFEVLWPFLAKTDTAEAKPHQP